jgi:hypothetical protein
MTPERLIELYPRIYHMAEADSWPSIRQHGLLSSNDVATRSGVQGAASEQLRRGHRRAKVAVQVPGIGTIVLRDQLPMPAERIGRALPPGVTPADWYELINDRVFFWAEHHRLVRLLKSRQYGHLEHDVLTINTASLVAIHTERILLCHMNSGNTLPMMTARSPAIFMPIADYPVNGRANPVKKVVEVTVLGGVPDIAEHVVEVRRMRGETVLGQIPI